MIKGVDISSVQANVDFHWLVSQGIGFVIIKCYTGNDGKDPFYEKSIAGAKAAGLKYGIYHFIYPLPSSPGHPGRDPKEQAKLHYEAAGDQQIVCCDLEWPEPPDWAKWGCTADQINKWTLEYLAEYERLSGVRPLVYTYPFFAKALNLPADFANYKLWLASYQNPPQIPHPWTDWVMWQDGGGTTGDKMTLNTGIPVDSDVVRDLSLWDVAVSIPTPVPQPISESTPTPVPVPISEPTPAPVPPQPAPAPIVPVQNNTNFFIQIIQFLLKLLGIKTQ